MIARGKENLPLGVGKLYYGYTNRYILIIVAYTGATYVEVDDASCVDTEQVDSTGAEVTDGACVGAILYLPAPLDVPVDGVNLPLCSVQVEELVSEHGEAAFVGDVDP